MRKFFIFAAISLISAFVVTACSDDDDQNRLVLGTEALTFYYDEVGQPQTVTVDTDAASFKAQASQDVDWLQISESTNSFNVTITKVNEGEAKREATITVTAGDANAKEVKVTQESASSGTYDYTITITGADDMEFEWDEINDEKSFTVTTDSPDGINTPVVTYANPANNNWLSVKIDPSDKTKVLVTATKENEEEDDREATITFSAKDARSKSVLVTQTGYVDYSITFENGENTGEITFEAEEELTQTIEVFTVGTALAANIDETATWITNADFDGNILSVTVESNGTAAPRVGNIEITNDEGATATLSVIQSGLGINLLGTWKYSSRSSTAEALFNGSGTKKEGEVTITLTDDGLYAVTGVIGLITELEEIVDPCFFLEVEETENGDIITIARRIYQIPGPELPDPVQKPAFTHEGTDYFFSTTIKTSKSTPTLSEEVSANNLVCTYVKSGDTETITLPTKFTVTAEELPELTELYPEIVGEQGDVVYTYYTAFYHPRQGLTKTPVESHTDVVFTRTK